MSGISAWSIRNPVPTIVLFVCLALSGLVGFSKLRVNDMPDIDVPAVTVTAIMPGAAPTELETQVTRLIEDCVSGLGDVEHIRSSINEGVSTTTIDFAIGTDVMRATEDVRNAVASVRQEFPADVLDPTVQRVDTTSQPILTFIVDAPRMAIDELSRFIDNDIAKTMHTVNGVARLQRVGGVDQEIRVHVDPNRLMALGITVFEVSEKLRSQNVNRPGGRLTIAEGEQAIRTLGSARGVQDLAQARLALRDGTTVALSELGAVERSWAEPRQSARLDEREVVGFDIFRSIGTGEVRVAEAVRTKIVQFAAAHPDVIIREVSNSTDDVLESYAAAMEALSLGAALAVIVVFYFLRDLRATLISSMALPLSLLPTFGVMYLFNQSLNNVTLLGLALVVGILVDDAIVETENIVRHMRETGKTALEAAIEAADAIGLAVVATTFSIVAVFLPVGLMPGIPGQLFKSFAIAVCTSVIFSLAVARMLTPLMGAYLMRDRGRLHDQPSWLPAYLRVLGWTLRRRWITILSGVAFFAGAMHFPALMPTDFIPATDGGRSKLALELAPGASLRDTEAAVKHSIAILKARPEVKSVYAALGAQTFFGGIGDDGASGEVRKATLTVNLKPRSERSLTQQQFETSVAPQLAEVPGIRFRFGADGQSGSKVEVTLRSDDMQMLTHAAAVITRELQQTAGLRNASSSISLARPEVSIVPKPDKAASLGVSAETIARTVSIATLGDSGPNLPQFNLQDRQIPIRIMIAERARSELEQLISLHVPTTTGPVPLSSVADITLGAGPNQIDRVDRSRSATIEAELAGLTTGQAEEIVANLTSVKSLPAGVTRQLAGDAESMDELFSGFFLAIASGIVLLLCVITLLFNSFIQPITILTALPLSMGGAFGLMLATETSLSMPALIGILMLMGIAAKNSILLVECAIATQESGMGRTAALTDAARRRARPIIMTTVAMIAGMLPLAVGIGADAEFRAPMAIAVIGGLLSSTALSLIYVPAVYSVMDDLQIWLRRTLAAYRGGASAQR